MNKTLFDKVWDNHLVSSIKNGPDILYIDKHLIHEVTSPQAFDILKERKIDFFRPEKTIATVDHNVPTLNQHLPIKDLLSRNQIKTLTENCKKHGITLFGLGNQYQGIVHVIGPELGITQPGMTIVCGDSHTSTHGAFGCIAFGIGTSQVAQVFSSQAILVKKPKSMRIIINGNINENVQPKDIILYIISKLGTDAGNGYFVEFSGEVFENMTMEGRMTVCNMSIEMGARGGMISPDKKTIDYVIGRKFSPKDSILDKKIKYWKTLKTDCNAVFDKEYELDGNLIKPMITYGTNPGMAMKIDGTIPYSKDLSFKKALKYMGLKAGKKLLGKKINYVFIGSCTNSRIEDFRAVAKIINGKKKSKNVNALIVPGSQQVAKQIIDENLDIIFKKSGFEIRQPGCSACLAMNEDKIPDGEYCVSTSNRNFEGRQGQGARTFLASPETAAKVAINGKISL